jgi:hypothetical protein
VLTLHRFPEVPLQAPEPSGVGHAQTRLDRVAELQAEQIQEQAAAQDRILLRQLMARLRK